MVDTPTGTDTTIEDRITAAMESDGPQGQPEDAPKEASEAAPEEAQQAEPEETEDADAEDQPEQSEDESEGDAPEDESEEEQESDAEPPVYTVTIDGQEVEVPADELVKGYQRQSDYTRKTQELAELRKAEEAKIVQAQQQYAQALQTVETFLQSQGPQPPDPSLRENDPIEYLTQMDAYRAHREQLQAAQAERTWLQQQQEQRQAEERKSLVQQEEQRLLEVIPQWRNPDVAKKEKTEIADFLKSVGYSEQEISSVARSRDLLVARDAMKYRQLQSQKPKAIAKAKGKPKVAKPGTSQKTTTEFSSAKQRVKKTGSVDDAARAIGLMNLE